MSDSLEMYQRKVEKEQAEIRAIQRDPDTLPVMMNQVRSELEARAAVWLAELARMFAVWAYEWQEPEREFRKILMLPGQAIFTWQHPTNGKHLTIIIEDEEFILGDERIVCPGQDASYVYYGYGPHKEKFDGSCEYPALTYLLWYWYFH